MEKILNKFDISGKLVKNNLDLKTNNQGVKYIYGNLILRTTDDCEHIINVYCDSVKSTYNKETKVRTYTGEQNRAYNGLLNVLDYSDLETAPDEAVILTIRNGAVSLNDYINKNNELSSIIRLSATYITSNANINPNNLQCKILVNGIIKEMNDEFENGVATGNLLVDLLVINTIGGYRDVPAEASSCYPITLTIPKETLEDFNSVGYYCGSFASFEYEPITIKGIETRKGFGGEIINTLPKRYNRVFWGSNPLDISSVGLSEDIVDALLNKREIYLKQLECAGFQGNKSNQVLNSSENTLLQKQNGFQTSGSSGFGSFGTGITKNPFAKN